jgi:hypothetical protein
VIGGGVGSKIYCFVNIIGEVGSSSANTAFLTSINCRTLEKSIPTSLQGCSFTFYVWSGISVV